MPEAVGHDGIMWDIELRMADTKPLSLQLSFDFACLIAQRRNHFSYESDWEGNVAIPAPTTSSVSPPNNQSSPTVTTSYSLFVAPMLHLACSRSENYTIAGRKDQAFISWPCSRPHRRPNKNLDEGVAIHNRQWQYSSAV